jgi:hypothetical protein
MGRKAWIIFGIVQLFGELGPWGGLRMKSVLGPALWVAGMLVMMPGRLIGLFVTEKLLWNAGLGPHLTDIVLILVEVPANLAVWLLCAHTIKLIRKRHAGRSPSTAL